MSYLAKANTSKHTEVTAIVYPACQCGAAWTAHCVKDCAGYIPSRPIQDYGTVSVTSPDLLVRFWWGLEKWIKARRQARMQSLNSGVN